MRKIEHIGIAVKDLEKSNELFRKLIGKEHFKTEIVEGEGVETSFFQVGETKVELLQATRPDSPIAKYLGLFGVVLASINIFGGFAVTQRMLAMYKKKGK